MQFRLFLAVVWLGLTGFTAIVAARHGLDLFSIFFRDIAKGEWPGQFNADFTTLLALSGLWCAWRGKWSPLALFHGLIAFVGGGVALYATLLVLHVRHQGDMRKVLLGAQE